MSKFSYVKELLIPKVRLVINGFFFTSEGYSRAKSILLAKFDKSIKIAPVHVQCINTLPVIQNHIQSEYMISMKS